MTPKLFIATYVDEDLTKSLAEQLRRHGFDAISTQEIGHIQRDDEWHLEFAISQERAILTRNRDHYMQLYDEYWQAGKTHYGIIITQQLDVGEMLRRMLSLLDNVTAEEMMNTLRYLSEFK